MKIHRRMHSLAWLLAAWIGHYTLQANAAPGATNGWKIEPGPQRWTAQGFAEAMDLSGIATANGRHCLVASDELTSVQMGQIDANAGEILAGGMVPLLKPLEGVKLEIDAEGVAAASDGSRYYVTGSHGVGKKKGDMQPGRFAVYELPVDPATGAVRREGIRTASLRTWFEQSAEFGRYLDQPLQMNGLNIEGLAWAGGRLFFGLRGPNLDGFGHVIETDAESLFRGDAIQCVVHRLPLGEGRGVRDLVACRDGFLLVSGNASAEASRRFPVSEAREEDARFQLGWWRPGRAHPLTWIGDIPAGGGKAEGLLVLKETAGYIDIVCLFDGAPEGGPVAYRLHRPAGANGGPTVAR